MKGRIYAICTPENKIDLTEEITPLGDGAFRYTYIGGIPKVALAGDIYCFADDGGEYHNSLVGLVCKVWHARYNLRVGMLGAVFPSGCAVGIMTHRNKTDAQLFEKEMCQNMLGKATSIYIGSEGDIVINHKKTLHPCHIVWDKYLAAHDYCKVSIDNDGFKYKVGYKDIEKKPPVGFGRISNVIFNYISAFPNGISSRDIEIGLNMRHPSVAGRISEMDKAGRIHRVDTIKYHPQGKANSIWVISNRE